MSTLSNLPTPDHEADIAAYEAISSGSDVPTLIKAARAYNWRLSSPTVQGWTSQDHTLAQEICTGNRWVGCAPVNSSGTLVEVESCFKYSTLVGSLFAWDLSQPLLDQGQQWLEKQKDLTSQKALWLTTYAINQTLGNQRVKDLGLYHWGEVKQDELVLRFVYKIPQNFLHKPDWRHGYPNFYWAACPHVLDSGKTRSLSTGDLCLPEWVCSLDKIDPNLHLVSVYKVNLQAEDFAAPVPTYWATLTEHMMAYRDARGSGV